MTFNLKCSVALDGCFNGIQQNLILKDLKDDVDNDDDYDNDDECIAWRGNGFITELGSHSVTLADTHRGIAM